MLKGLELSEALHQVLKEQCESLGIEFMSTPFDEESADFLMRKIGVARIKVPSGEITNAPFLLHVARLGLPLILSTGMSDFADIETALKVIAHGFSNSAEEPDLSAPLDQDARDRLGEKLTLLHCTSQYPAPIEETNLNVLLEMAAPLRRRCRPFRSYAREPSIARRSGPRREDDRETPDA